MKEEDLENLITYNENESVDGNSGSGNSNAGNSSGSSGVGTGTSGGAGTGGGTPVVPSGTDDVPSGTDDVPASQTSWSDAVTDAYRGARDEALRSYDEEHKADKDLIETLGVDPAKIRQWEELRQQNERRRKHTDLFRGLQSIIDLGIAAGHGNVYQRKYDKLDFDEKDKLLRAERVAEEQRVAKEKEDLRKRYEDAKNKFAQSEGEQAAKAKQNELIYGWRAEDNEKNRQSREAMNKYSADVRKQTAFIRSSSGGGRSGGSGKNKDVIEISLGGNRNVKVNKANYDKYIATLQQIILDPSNKDLNVLALKHKVYSSDSNGKMTWNNLQLHQGEHGMADWLYSYIARTDKDLADLLSDQWQAIISQYDDESVSEQEVSTNNAPPSRSGQAKSEDNTPPNRRKKK